MKKAILFYNPMSGQRFVPEHLDEILEHFYKKGVNVFANRLEYHEKIDPEWIIQGNFDYVIAAGGDGTLRSIAQLMYENDIEKPFIPLGAGTCNNFTTNIGIDGDILDGIDSIMNGSAIKIDMGLINNTHVFLSSIAGGAFVDTAFSTDDNLKETLGPLAYYIKPMTELKNLTTFPVRIETDYEVIETDIYMFLILSGKSVGTFTDFMDRADLCDGIMELILIEKATPAERANLFLKILKKEDFTNVPGIRFVQAAKFKLSSTKEIQLSVDGEAGPKLPVEINVQNKVLNVVLPYQSEICSQK